MPSESDYIKHIFILSVIFMAVTAFYFHSYIGFYSDAGTKANVSIVKFAENVTENVTPPQPCTTCGGGVEVIPEVVVEPKKPVVEENVTLKVEWPVIDISLKDYPACTVIPVDAKNNSGYIRAMNAVLEPNSTAEKRLKFQDFMNAQKKYAESGNTLGLDEISILTFDLSGDNAIGSVTLYIEIPRIVLERNHIDEDTLTLMHRYPDGSWKPGGILKKIGEDSRTIRYLARMEKDAYQSSLFAVSGGPRPLICQLCESGEWSQCIKNQETRLYSECGEHTNYGCRPTAQTRMCGMAIAQPSAPPLEPLIFVAVAIAISGIVVLRAAMKRQHSRSTYIPVLMIVLAAGAAITGSMAGYVQFGSANPADDYAQLSGNNANKITAAASGIQTNSTAAEPPANVMFVLPTPENGTNTTDTTHTIKALLSAANTPAPLNNIEWCKLEWNGANETMNKTMTSKLASTQCSITKGNLAAGTYAYKVWTKYAYIFWTIGHNKSNYAVTETRTLIISGNISAPPAIMPDNLTNPPLLIRPQTLWPDFEYIPDKNVYRVTANSKIITLCSPGNAEAYFAYSMGGGPLTGKTPTEIINIPLDFSARLPFVKPGELISYSVVVIDRDRFLLYGGRIDAVAPQPEIKTGPEVPTEEEPGIPETPSEQIILFDIGLNLPQRQILAGSFVDGDITITNRGTLRPADITLEYGAIDTNNQTIVSGSEDARIYDKISVKRSLQIPLGASRGFYTFYAAVVYNEQRIATEKPFFVYIPEVTAQPVPYNIIFIFLLYALLLLLLLFLFWRRRKCAYRCPRNAKSGNKCARCKKLFCDKHILKSGRKLYCTTHVHMEANHFHGRHHGKRNMPGINFQILRNSKIRKIISGMRAKKHRHRKRKHHR